MVKTHKPQNESPPRAFSISESDGLNILGVNDLTGLLNPVKPRWIVGQNFPRELGPHLAVLCQRPERIDLDRHVDMAVVGTGHQGILGGILRDIFDVVGAAVTRNLETVAVEKVVG